MKKKFVASRILTDIDLIEISLDYERKKIINIKEHPTEDLLLLTYSRTCQYNEWWDDITLQCRGLIVDREGNIIARPLPKFFNYSEVISSNIIPQNMRYKVYDKVDGSCIITYYSKKEDKYLGATKGSFTSKQALRASELLRENEGLQNYLKEHKNYTFIFEYISPDNRIVVEYPKEELILLAVINILTGDEIEIDELKNWYYTNTVKTYDPSNKNLTDIFQHNFNEDEGVVIKFENNFRLKVKNSEYIRLHRILTELSSKDLWEYLKEKKDLEEVIKNVPDEFDAWVKTTVNDLNDRYQKLYEANYNLYTYELSNLTNRKSVAEKIMNASKFNKDIVPGICFLMYDKDPDYDKKIWDQIKPKYEKAFKNEGEEL